MASKDVSSLLCPVKVLGGPNDGATVWLRNRELRCGRKMFVSIPTGLLGMSSEGLEVTKHYCWVYELTLHNHLTWAFKIQSYQPAMTTW